MNIKEKIADFIFWLTHPRFWIMNYTYSTELNERVNKDLDKDFTFIEEYYAELNGRVYWIQNYPYGFQDKLTGLRPSCRTIHKFHKKLNRKRFDL